MSADETNVSFKSEECLAMSCPVCGPATVVVRLWVHLRDGRACAACKCGQLIMALHIDRAAFVACVAAKFDQGEPSRILKPTMVPPKKIRDN